MDQRPAGSSWLGRTGALSRVFQGLSHNRSPVAPVAANSLAQFDVDEHKIISAMKSRGSNRLRAVTEELKRDRRFVYSLLRDTLVEADSSTDRRMISGYVDAVQARLQSLSNWRQEDNETIDAIVKGKIDADEIKPHIRLEASAYDNFYSDQSDRLAEKAIRTGSPSADATHLDLELSSNVNHSFRYSHAVALVENLLAIVGALGEAGATVRWIDVGCGTGHFANAVDPRRYGLENWEIIGCDMQTGKIAVAEKQKTKGRHFFASDAFQMLADYKGRGESFDLVSMFEFLEHLSDPLKFIRQLDTFSPRFVLAASPLGQKLNQPRDTKPDRVHLWSFSRRAWEQMFTLAGFNVVYSSEIRVGSYIGGLDWLSIVCGPSAELSEKRTTIGVNRAKSARRGELRSDAVDMSAKRMGADDQQLVWSPAVTGSPLIVFVHGGGWRSGDKRQGEPLKHFLIAGGFSLALVHYPLFPAASVIDQVEAVRVAVTKLQGRAEEFGFDPKRVVLMGHSAGANLVCLAAPHLTLQGLVLLEPLGLSIAEQLKRVPALSAIFGADPVLWEDLSPLKSLERGVLYPSVFIGQTDRRRDSAEQANLMAEGLRAQGHDPEVRQYHGRKDGNFFGPLGDNQEMMSDILAFLRSNLQPAAALSIEEEDFEDHPDQPGGASLA